MAQPEPYLRKRSRRRPRVTFAPSTLVGLIWIAVSAAALADAAPMKCWTNSDGVRECGDTVPPEYAQEPHEMLNSQGIMVKRIEGSRSREEIEAEQQARIAEAEAAREAERAARIAAESDRILLSTYNSVEDLELARDGQLDHIESQIRMTEARIRKLQETIDQRVVEAARIERQGKAPPKVLTDEIDQLRNQIDESHAFISSKGTEFDSVTAQFDADIQRYRLLRPGSSAARGD